MFKAKNHEEIDLTVLAERLLLEGMPVQLVIAREAGVSQATVSRATRGQIKGVSKATRRLWKYTSARMLILSEVSSDNGAKATKLNPNQEEGNLEEAIPSILQKMHGEKRKRAAPLPRRRSQASNLSLKSDRQQLAQAALAGLQNYLDDAFDPMLVIEQLAVLRRAQDFARRLHDKEEPESIADE
jgi:hypothetical protein